MGLQIGFSLVKLTSFSAMPPEINLLADFNIKVLKINNPHLPHKSSQRASKHVPYHIGLLLLPKLLDDDSHDNLISRREDNLSPPFIYCLSAFPSTLNNHYNQLLFLTIVLVFPWINHAFS